MNCSNRTGIGLRALIILVIAFSLSPIAAWAQDAPAFDPANFAVALQPTGLTFESPVFAGAPRDGSGRLFVVEQAGRIKIVQDDRVLDAPFIDITDRVESGGAEQGLLSIAFPVDFAASGFFYVYYTARSDEGVGNTTISRFRVSSDEPNLADATSEDVLLSIVDERSNHNGGMLAFGPDGYLYAGLGDGGGQGDPKGSGQDLYSVLGSVIRIAPNPSGSGYTIPADNPYADGDQGAPEVWAKGLRNPWRLSFDRLTGDLYIGDVGQGQFEEVDWIPADSPGGENFGWNTLEGYQCYLTESCDETGLTPPIFVYSHDFGCSIVGGYVYRGEEYPDMYGVYLFADYCTGLLWGMAKDAEGDWIASEPLETGAPISSFGEDESGELYVVALSGELYRVTS